MIDRVQAGERLTVTRDGRAVAELRPLPARAIRTSTLLKRWSRVPSIDSHRLRADLDRLLDPVGVSRPHAVGLLDTNTLILLPRLSDPNVLPHEAVISAVTLAELSVGPLIVGGRERESRQAVLQQVEADFDPLPFDVPAARAFGRVAASLRRSGRKPAARAYDAMIAAIAISNDLPLYTCNPQDFQGIDGLAVVRVPHPDRP